MDLIKTHMLLAQQEETKQLLPRYTSNTGLNGNGGFWKGANLMGILNTIGGTWSQIEQARNGLPVYAKQPNGKTQNIAPILVSKLEQQAKAQQVSTNKLMELMQMQLLKQSPPPPKKDNNNLLIIGAVGIATIGLVLIWTRKK